MKPCHVYIIGHPHAAFGHAVKVGITESLGSRLSKLQTGSCEDLELYFSFRLPNRAAAARVEKRFHEYFQDWGIRGEWFGMPPDGALMMLSFFVVELVKETTPPEFISSVRAGTGLLAAFDILDQLPDEFHARWNEEWETHVTEARAQ